MDEVAEMAERRGCTRTQAQMDRGTSASRTLIMDVAKARRELKWRPKHDALQTLRETIAVEGGTCDRFVR